MAKKHSSSEVPSFDPILLCADGEEEYPLLEALLAQICGILWNETRRCLVLKRSSYDMILLKGLFFNGGIALALGFSWRVCIWLVAVMILMHDSIISKAATKTMDLWGGAKVIASYGGWRTTKVLPVFEGNTLAPFSRTPWVFLYCALGVLLFTIGLAEHKTIWNYVSLSILLCMFCIHVYVLGVSELGSVFYKQQLPAWKATVVTFEEDVDGEHESEVV